MAMFSKRPDYMLTLREAIGMSKASEELLMMPERFASIISLFDSESMHPAFRRDVFKLLFNSTDIAHSVLDHTFPADLASQKIAAQMALLSNLLNFLQSRPATAGFTILLPSSGMVGFFTTEGEAQRQLETYVAMGLASSARVVPAALTSNHVVQPKLAPPAAPAPENLDEPIPLVEPCANCGALYDKDHTCQPSPSQGPIP